MLRAAVVLTPLALALLVLPGSAPEAREPDRWLEARSPHFVVISNAGEEHARGVSQQFERVRALLRRVLTNARVDPRDPVVVLAVNNERRLRELLPQFWERRSRRPVAAYWMGPHEHHVVLRVNTPAAERIRHVFHEYVHLLTHVNVPDPPAWLDEGPSELWGTAVVSDEAVEVGWPPARHLKALRERESWIPLDELLATPRVPDARDSKRLSMFYAQSWALTHCLVLGTCLDRPVRAPTGLELAPLSYVEQLRKGTAPVEAGRRAFGDLAGLEQALAEYVRAGRFRVVRMAVPSQGKEVTLQARALLPTEALAVRAGILVDGERPAAALPLLTEALALDPHATPALETLGRFHFQQNNPDEAAQWFDRAINSGPATHLAHYYRAILTRTLQGLAATEENHLRRAIALNDTFAPAYARLADLIALGDRRSACGRCDERSPGAAASGAEAPRLAEALALARQAVELEPDNAGYRELLQEISQGQAPDDRR